jgi:hypothetical protein
MSVAQRKKQGITTVSPPKKAKKKTDKKIHYDVGQVDVEVNHSHQNKLKVLRMTMENFQHNEGRNLPLDSMQGRMFEADLYKVDELLIGGKDILTKEEMLEMNMLYRLYTK